MESVKKNWRREIHEEKRETYDIKKKKLSAYFGHLLHC